MYRQISVLTVALLLLSIAGQVMAQQDPDLLGWWKLDDGQGTLAADSSGKGHNGTILNPNGGLGAGGSVWVDDPERGMVIGFNGTETTGACVTTKVTMPVMTLTNDFTWAFWAKQPASQATNNDTILGNRNGGNQSTPNGQFIKFTPTRFEFFNDDYPAYANAINYATIPSGVWVHHAVVKDGTSLTYYRDGIKTLTNTVVKTVEANYFYMGADAFNGVVEAWQGYLSDVKLYTRALSLAEISTMTGLVKARKPIPADGALNVAMPLLQWTPGGTALFHNVYLGSTPNLTDADLKSARSPMAMYYHVAGVTPGATYYWRVDEIEKDMVTIHAGDVWTFTVQDVVAYHPGPADKANDASQSPTLTWMPGQGATKHQVFFGDSLDAVTQGAAGTDKGTLAMAETTFAPGVLEGLTTYYWRVDEIVSSGTKTGPVWSFTTSLSVDDFESYTDDLAAKTTIFDTWIDGLTDGLSGSTVGNATAPFAEQAIVHGGKQSMPLDFNNVKSPFFSETTREFAPTMDWTASSADTLVLFVRGTPGNKPAPLYIAVEDASKKNAAVTYPDSAIVAASKWTEWKIPLSTFAGVNLAKVKKVYIGVGDKNAPAAGGAGRIYIDDIFVTVPVK
jgi:hypothetical protein